MSFEFSQKLPWTPTMLFYSQFKDTIILKYLHNFLYITTDERISEAENKLAETEADRDRLQAELNKQVTILTDKCNQLEIEKEELEAKLKADIDSMRNQILSEFFSYCY